MYLYLSIVYIYIQEAGDRNVFPRFCRWCFSHLSQNLHVSLSRCGGCYHHAAFDLPMRRAGGERQAMTLLTVDTVCQYAAGMQTSTEIGPKIPDQSSGWVHK